MKKPPASEVEGEVVAAIIGWLIMRSADRVASQIAQQQRPDAAMRDDGGVTEFGCVACFARPREATEAGASG
jgi:hypothetical protein